MPTPASGGGRRSASGSYSPPSSSLLVAIAWGATNAHDTKLLAQENLISQTNHHAASVKQQNLIIAQNQEIIALVNTVHDTQVTSKRTLLAIANLETEVATVIQGLPAAEKILAAEAKGLASDLMALCSASGANCAALPAP